MLIRQRQENNELKTQIKQAFITCSVPQFSTLESLFLATSQESNSLGVLKLLHQCPQTNDYRTIKQVARFIFGFGLVLDLVMFDLRRYGSSLILSYIIFDQFDLRKITVVEIKKFESDLVQFKSSLSQLF